MSEHDRLIKAPERRLPYKAQIAGHRVVSYASAKRRDRFVVAWRQRGFRVKAWGEERAYPESGAKC